MSLSFENEHLRDKVEKTTNLLRMYELDSPHRRPDQAAVLHSARSSSPQYDLDTLRHMAKLSFKPRRQSPGKQALQDLGSSAEQLRLRGLGKKKSTPAGQAAVPLTDRQNVNRQGNQSNLEQQRLQLFKSMVNGSRHQSSSKQSSQTLFTYRSAEKAKASRDGQSKNASALKPPPQKSGEICPPLNLTQKLAGIKSHRALALVDSVTAGETRDESTKDFMSRTMVTRHAAKGQTTGSSGLNRTLTARQSLKQEPSFTTSNEFVATKAGLTQRPVPSAYGHLRASQQQVLQR